MLAFSAKLILDLLLGHSSVEGCACGLALLVRVKDKHRALGQNALPVCIFRIIRQGYQRVFDVLVIGDGIFDRSGHKHGLALPNQAGVGRANRQDGPVGIDFGGLFRDKLAPPLIFINLIAAGRSQLFAVAVADGINGFDQIELDVARVGKNVGLWVEDHLVFDGAVERIREKWNPANLVAGEFRRAPLAKASKGGVGWRGCEADDQVALGGAGIELIDVGEKVHRHFMVFAILGAVGLVDDEGCSLGG